MKNLYIKPWLYTVFAMVLVSSCTDVVDVELEDETPNLVIEGSLDWSIDENGTLDGSEQTITLSMSTPYFSQDEVTNVTGASVVVTNDSTGETYIFQDQNDGTYYTNTFEPVENQTFTLHVEYDGETYEGSDTFLPGSLIEYYGQSTMGGFDSDLIEINFYIQDDATLENFYLEKFYRHGDLLNSIETFSDEFVNGNLINDFYEISDDDDDDIEPLQPGDVVDIYLYSITENYFNYMMILLNQSEATGNPFASIPVALQGNCKNISGGKDAYGYFRTTQVHKITYTVL
ncbi:DUF4249 domain-containing protein [Neptunitalea lumnitzerae]|nr:DUF4249 domain-containing protein [Neptunitalea sp. Y10]